jgi:hypothetical protein
MKHRHVYSTPSLAGAEQAIAAARRAGVQDDDISLIARSDIEVHSIPTERVETSADTMPAAWRGALQGGSTGLVAGLVALAIPPLGVTVAGIAALTAVGAAVGTWSSALMGSAIPSTIRRRFEDEIEQGRILVVVDAEPERLPAIDAALRGSGAQPLPYDAPAAVA